MVSKIAKSAVEKLKSEGLSPTFEDVVKLNALGLKVERGGLSYEFGSVPRVAFLGDYVFREPTVAKRIWIEEALSLLNGDYFNQVCLTAYALNCPSNELPSLDRIGVLVAELAKFRDEVLLLYTDRQIMDAIEYALRGDSPSLDEEKETTGEKEEKEDVSALPEKLVSVSRQLLQEALSYGIDDECKNDLTVPELEKVIALAAMHSGVDVMKGEHGQAVGAFYKALGKIRERLTKERDLSNGEG